MRELVDANGNIFGTSTVQVIGSNGKPKTSSAGGAPTGPAGGDLAGTYPNPTVNWNSGLTTYNTAYYPLSTNPAGYLTAITSGQVTSALGYTPVNQSGDSMLGFLTLVSDPTSSLHAATKQYVDNLSAGINFHEPCHAATTGNLPATYLNGTLGVGATLTSTANGAIVVDTHVLAVGERVLVWQQSSGIENGIYDVTNTGSPSTPWVLTRSSDADNSPNGELQNGDFTFIQQGASYGGYGFILNTTGPITVGTTAINYVQFNAAQAVAAGYGLQELTPNVLSVDTSLIATASSLSAYLTTTSAAATYYPLTNPSGYISGITSLDVTTALGFTPYDSTNPAGYITSAALSPYLTSSTAATTYTPLSRNINTTAPLTGGGDLSTDRTIAITQATTSTNGYLSSTDWNTFNNKTKIHYNTATAPQILASNTVTYITNSNITTANIKAGTVITWTISVSKTNAGTAAPVWTVRFGTNSSTADSTLLTFTGSAQTAAIDTGLVTIQCVFRSVGSGVSAILSGHYNLTHNLASTGLSNVPANNVVALSSGFNSTTANAFLGVTVNSGASAIWTINQVFVKIENVQ